MTWLAEALLNHIYCVLAEAHSGSEELTYLYNLTTFLFRLKMDRFHMKADTAAEARLYY